MPPDRSVPPDRDVPTGPEDVRAGPPVPPARHEAVLTSAFSTFARLGYRKTSMEDVAQAARISRPGLYFLFSSKELLFRAAVAQTLDRDLADTAQELADPDRPLQDSLLAAFDRWAGRYVGLVGRDLSRVVDDHPDLLGDVAQTAPLRFERLVTDAVARDLGPAAAVPLARTLVSTSIGVKHQVQDREDYLARLGTAIELLLGSALKARRY